MSLTFATIEKSEELRIIVETAVKKKKFFSADVETEGFNYFRDKLVGIGIAFNEEIGSIYIPIHHKYGQTNDGKKTLEILRPLFENNKFCSYNAIFDVGFLRQQANFDIDFSNVVDVQLIYYALGRYKNLKLSTAANDVMGFKVFNYHDFILSQDLILSKHKISDAKISSVSEYCGRDALATLMLYNRLYDKMKNNFIFNLESLLLPVIFWLKMNGVLIDKDMLEQERSSVAAEIEALEVLMKKQANIVDYEGEESFNFRSPKQVSKLLFDTLKIKAKKFTKTGQESSGKDALLDIRDKNIVAWNLYTYRGMSKVHDSYLQKFNSMCESDGRIHAHYNQTGTITGRFSSSDPNLQNIPNAGEWIVKENGKEPYVIDSRMRDVFIAEKNKWLVECDYNQTEARLAAGITQERVLLDAFANNIDFHTKTASMIFQLPVDKISKEQRRLAKTLNFALMYGGGPRVVFNQFRKSGLGISYETAKDWREKYIRGYSKMFLEAEKISSEAVQNGFAKTIFDRIIPIENFKSREIDKIERGKRTAYSGRVSGSAADILKLTLVKLYKEIKNRGWMNKTKFIITVHDSFMFEVDDDVLIEYMEMAAKLAEFKKEGFPDIFVDIKIGKRWGKMLEKEKKESFLVFGERTRLEFKNE